VQPGEIAVHAALLGAVAAATWLPIVPRWIRLWMPLLVLFSLYAELPVLIRAAGGSQYYDAMVAAWEQRLFGTQPARSWATAVPTRLLSEPLHLAYLSYYGIIFVPPAILYLTGREDEFSEALFAIVLTFIVCFATYIAFPVTGPRYRWSSEVAHGPVRQFTLWLLETRSSPGTAFPSSHVAVSVTQSILAIRCFGRRGIVVAVLTFALALGAIYGGFHYAIDVIVGLAVGIACAVTALTMFGRTRTQSVQANAIAPT
jgi:membrane-associated phospholipid phosphatase